MRSAAVRFCHRVLCGLAIASWFSAPVLGAAFLEYYKNGVAAIESQRWSLAAEMMQKAIEQQPDARSRVKKSLYFRRYLPHFYLGQALYESGDCIGALAAWKESESQGVVKRFPEYQQILEGRRGCDQMVDLQGALDAALRAVEGAEGSATQSRRRLSELSSQEATVGVLLRRQSEAEASLIRVRRRLASDDIVLDAVEEAATLAAIAKAEFESIRQQADELKKLELSARKEETATQIQSLVERARQALRSSEYLRPYPTAVARHRLAVEQALEHASTASNQSLSAGELQAIRAELTTATRDLRRAAAPPPDELQAAAEAFLARDYQAVLTILGEREFDSARASSSSHMLRAAALFSLFYSSGATDESLLEQARQEVLACQGADQEQSPSVAVFSPSFVAFFESQTLEQPVEEGEDAGLDEGP